LEIKKIEETV